MTFLNVQEIDCISDSGKVLVVIDMTHVMSALG